APAAHSASPELETLDRGLYEASGAVAPRHPVTGRPVLNVVPEPLEIRMARDFWDEYAEAARARGDDVDPHGRRLDHVRRRFAELVAVAHRPELPWEVHLVDDPTPNAFTAGGGLVVVLSGLFDDDLVDDDDDLSVVLAHEIAHVAMLHPPTRVTWLGVGGVVSSNAKDPYYRAAYTFEQEAEADRLSVLYLALAGIDPESAPQLWARIAEHEGNAAARAGYLHDHPVSAERVAITRETARAVERYRVRGPNPHAREILADNVLYPHPQDEGYRPGSGVARAATALLDGLRVHQRAAHARDERRAAASAQARVRVVATWDGPGPDGGPGLMVDVWNGADRAIGALGMSLAYWSGGEMIYLEDCRARITIAPRTTRPLRCPRQEIDADRIEPRVVEVSWH
ncbi:MAG TPA: M48 family metallopeptidase, partial [Myxococcota bacterium]|nr:M48 family metallopeptidase [Myxococcota bacterium]